MVGDAKGGQGMPREALNSSYFIHILQPKKLNIFQSCQVLRIVNLKIIYNSQYIVRIQNIHMQCVETYLTHAMNDFSITVFNFGLFYCHLLCLPLSFYKKRILWFGFIGFMDTTMKYSKSSNLTVLGSEVTCTPQLFIQYRAYKTFSVARLACFYYVE